MYAVPYIYPVYNTHWNISFSGNKLGLIILGLYWVYVPASVSCCKPAYRCSAGGPLLARFGNRTDGCPQQFPNTTSILGDGALGSHGGSGLSGVGGKI